MAQPTRLSTRLIFFFFNDTATTEIYTLSLHDALPISPCRGHPSSYRPMVKSIPARFQPASTGRSEEHTSELQSHVHIVCRLLLEKKKTTVATGRESIKKYRNATGCATNYRN